MWDLILAALVVVAALIILGRIIARGGDDRKLRPSIKTGAVSGGSGTEKKGPTRSKDRPTV